MQLSSIFDKSAKVTSTLPRKFQCWKSKNIQYECKIWASHNGDYEELTSVDFQRTTRRYIPEDIALFSMKFPRVLEKV
jgi:hypothetical protein